jgi:hypothetical protein
MHYAKNTCRSQSFKPSQGSNSNDIKHSENLPHVFGRHLTSMNIPPRKEDGYYTVLEDWE